MLIYRQKMSEILTIKENMDPKNIGKRIKEAREECGLSQQLVASIMGWKSHSSLVAIEKGEQEIKTWELLKFAEIFKVSPESLYREDYEKVSRPVILWRNKSENSEALLKEELRVLQYCQDYRLLERLLGASSSFRQQLRKEALDIATANPNWANRLADEIHKEMRLGDYPAEVLEKRLEEDYNVLIMYGELENGSAACCREETGSAIVMNDKECPWRQVFSLAHELFHLITWDNLLIKKFQSDSQLFKKNESLAESFAAALLMPTEMIFSDIGNNKLTYSFVISLARKYLVSTEAFLWRLCYLKFISAESIKEVLNDLDFRALDRSSFKKTTGKTSPISMRFLRLAYLAYEKGKISKGRLAEIVRVKLRDIDSYLSEKGLYITDDKEIEAHTP